MNDMNFGRALFQPTVLFALALMSVIVMMILPMPAFVLDIGLAVSFSLAILIFTVTLFIDRPLDFSAFPTVLLAALMLRLSLNVSSTKLIIGEGHTGTHAAGGVIQGFADFIMGGSVFLGIVVFGVLMIVNFMVITKGAGRMAEVSARFALDGMPGKQLAIDSDMSAGAIDHAEAKARREREQQETTFFGSLDGASKFVKGDAVAGLLITLLNLVMGLTMGVMVHGMDFADAFTTYSILTVGDGLVSQVPAVIISIAAALLLARGGATGSTDLALVSQLGRYPGALGTVAVLMCLFGLVPGLPFGPFFAGGLILGLLAYVVSRGRREQAKSDTATPNLAKKAADPSMGDLLDLDDIHIEFATDLVGMALDPATGLDARISNMRSHIARVYGLVLPEMRLTDDPSLASGTYVVRIQGVELAQARLRPDRMLLLVPEDTRGLPPGEDVKEPVYGAPARWISPESQESAALSGATIVSPAEVLATHLLEIVKKNFPRLLSFRSLRQLLSEMMNLSDPRKAEANRKMIDEFIPDRVPMDMLHQVLRLLLEEQVSIRNMPLILEAIAEGRSTTQQPEALCEYVRHRLGFQLVSDLKRPDGTIPLVQLDTTWEDTFAAYQLDGDRGALDIALPPDLFNRLADNVATELRRAGDVGISPAIVTSARRRRFVKTVLSARNIAAPVLAFEEIGLEARPSLVGTAAA